MNIHTANVDTIARVLVNVGPAKAEAIVAYRKKNGAFKSAEQLAMGKGIGLKTVEKNRDRLSFGGERKAKPVGKAGAGANVGPARRGRNGAIGGASWWERVCAKVSATGVAGHIKKKH